MECACELKSDEILVLRTILEHVLRGKRSPSSRELASLLKKPREAIVRAVRSLKKKDALLTKRGTEEIVSIYPFSMEPTKHQVILQDGTKLFAMCAVDALGAPIMVSDDAKIVSRCEMCNQEMIVEIKNEQIASISHPDMTICSTKAQIRPAAENCCPFVNFFCSEKHANDWIAGNPRPGHGFNLGLVRDRFPKIRECWKSYGETLGLR